MEQKVTRVNGETKADGISADKLAWMESAGVLQFEEPVSFMYMIPGESRIHLMTEREIRENTLDELKEAYEKTVEQHGKKEALQEKRKKIAIDEIRERFRALEKIAVALLFNDATPDERGDQWDAWAELFSRGQ